MKILRDGHIGYNEAIALTVIYIATKIFLAFPAVMVKRGYTAGWLLVIIATLVAVLAWLVMARLMTRFPGRSLVEISEELAGSLAGGFLSLVIFLFFLSLTILTLRQFSETVVTAILPETPISVITGTVLIAILYAGYQGLEAISRACFLISPFLAVALAGLLAGVLPFARFDYLFPLWGPGLPSLVKEGGLYSSVFAEILLLPLLYPALRRVEEFTRIGLWSIFISALLMVAVVGIFLLVIPFPVSRDISYPMYELARLVFIGRFVQRVEAIFIFIWIFGGLLKLTIGLYISTVTLARTLHLPVYRPLLFPLTVLVFALSVLAPDFPSTLYLTDLVYRWFGWAPSFGIPLLLLLLAVVRRKGVNKSGEQANPKP